MHRLLSVLSSQKNTDRNNPEVQTNRDHEENLQLVKNNGTFLSETAGRASKSDDLDFKLKLIDMLNDEGKFQTNFNMRFNKFGRINLGKTDDSSDKEKSLKEALKILKAKDVEDGILKAIKASITASLLTDQEIPKKTPPVSIH